MTDQKIKLRDFLLADAQDHLEDATKHAAYLLEQVSEIKTHAQELISSLKDLSVTLYRAVKAGDKEVPTVTPADPPKPIVRQAPNFEELLKDPVFRGFVELREKFNAPGGEA